LNRKSAARGSERFWIESELATKAGSKMVLGVLGGVATKLPEFKYPFIRFHAGSVWWHKAWATVALFTYYVKVYKKKPELYPEIKAKNSLVFNLPLTVALFEENSKKRTQNGKTGLAQMMKVATDHEDEPLGIRACDELAFTTFPTIFEPVLKQVNHLAIIDQKHDMDASKLSGNLKAPVHSARVVFTRNLNEVLFSPIIGASDRKYTEYQISKALSFMGGEFAGEYVAVGDMKEEVADAQMAFPKPDKFAVSAGIDKVWPQNRGTFSNANNTFAAHAMGDDHLTLIFKEKGNDFVALCTKAFNAHDQLRAIFRDRFLREFCHDDSIGYLSTHVNKCGTAMKIDVRLDLPGYAKEGLEALKHRCQHLNLDFSGVAQGSVMFDISNKHCMGETEVELAQRVLDGINILYEEDIALQKKHGMLASVVFEVPKPQQVDQLTQLQQNVEHNVKQLKDDMEALATKLTEAHQANFTKLEGQINDLKAVQEMNVIAKLDEETIVAKVEETIVDNIQETIAAKDEETFTDESS